MKVDEVVGGVGKIGRCNMSSVLRNIQEMARKISEQSFVDLKEIIEANVSKETLDIVGFVVGLINNTTIVNVVVFNSYHKLIHIESGKSSYHELFDVLKQVFHFTVNTLEAATVRKPASIEALRVSFQLNKFDYFKNLRKFTTKSLFELAQEGISIFHVNIKSIHSDCSGIITRIMRRT
ncbi:hypothetical protein Tco_1135370 [Tanacetum coccineum]